MLIKVYRIDTGATFKHAKEVLKVKPWDPDLVGEDHCYWLDGRCYKRLDREAWDGIRSARAKL